MIGGSTEGYGEDVPTTRPGSAEAIQWWRSVCGRTIPIWIASYDDGNATHVTLWGTSPSIIRLHALGNG